MRIEICADTDPGLARSNNEDSIAVDAATALCIVADGMGGHNAGEVASGMASAFLKLELGKWLAHAKSADVGAVEAAMQRCIVTANNAIYNLSRTNPQYSGMGTTLVVGVFRGQRLVLGHIGDSRCYRLRAGRLEQITKDHSLLQEQTDAGLLLQQTPPQALGNYVTRALGVSDLVQPDIAVHDVMSADLYLMCSDGLSDMVDDETIASILLSAEPLSEKTRQLIAGANRKGGRDNISVLLAHIREPHAKQGWLHSARRAVNGVLQGWRWK